MTSSRQTLLTIIACVALGMVIGGFAAYSWMKFEFGIVAALGYDSDIQNLVLHQRILKEIDDENVDLAVQILESQINAEIYFADSLLTERFDGLNQGHRNNVESVLKEISDYRTRPGFTERVQYHGQDEAGDARVRAILASYQTDAP